VQNVHVGRLIELDVEDASQVPAMCERLLANPLIEDYEVVELGFDGPEARRGHQDAGPEAPRRTSLA
jgi:phosphoribosylformylglycinamidine synthase